MTAIELKPITLPNLLTLVMAGAGCVWGYSALSAKVDQLEISRKEEKAVALTLEAKRDAVLEQLNNNLHLLSERVIRVETKQDILNGKADQLGTTVRSIPGATKP